VADACCIQNRFGDAVDTQVTLDQGIGQTHERKRSEFQRRGGQAERLTDVPGLNQRRGCRCSFLVARCSTFRATTHEPSSNEQRTFEQRATNNELR
jgi:hypothetical protein